MADIDGTPTGVSPDGLTYTATMVTRRQRRRTRIVWLVAFAFLFQQLATAAYACTMTQIPSVPAECEAMGMASAHEAPAICVKHCTPDVSTTAGVLSLAVPPLALPPAAFAVVDVVASTHILRRDEIPPSRSDPPPRLRYCSLLI